MKRREYINTAFVEHISEIDKHNNMAKSKNLSFSTRLIKESFGAYRVYHSNVKKKQSRIAQILDAWMIEKYCIMLELLL